MYNWKAPREINILDKAIGECYVIVWISSHISGLGYSISITSVIKYASAL